MKLSIAIPIYNAENILLNSYRKLKNLLEETGKDYEILFRNDASKDNSLCILKQIAQKDNKVRIFSHNPNIGLGYTLRKLFKSAQGEIIIYLDIDLSFDMSVFHSFLSQMKDTDVILASRYAGLPKEIPMKREFLSRLYHLLSRMLFNISVKDIGSGFVIFRKKVLDQIKLTSRCFGIHIDLFVQIQKAGFKIKEIPVKYIHNYMVGTFRVLKHGPKALSETFKVWWNIRRNRFLK